MLGIYIHTPYCVQKCPYCDFATVAVEAVPESPFVEAVCREIGDFPERAERDELLVPDGMANTVYLGGGTPSMLSPRSIANLLNSVRGRFGLAADVEVTLEANPGTEDEEKFAGYLAAGVDRLSIGVQSLNDEFLDTLGRIHNAEEARSAVRTARAAGFGNVSIDLMFALPGMSVEDWSQTLDEALELDPDHVSAYNLTVEASTPLAAWVREGKVVLPEDDVAAEMYEMLVERLAAADLPRYEISNFGRVSKHNHLYWSYDDYVSFGPSAHSFVRKGAGGTRWWNDRNPDRYLKSAGAPALGGREVLEGRRAMGEFAFTALRTTAGLAASRFESVFGTPMTEIFGETIRRFTSLGLLEESGDGVRLTDRGFLVADSVMGEFV